MSSNPEIKLQYWVLFSYATVISVNSNIMNLISVILEIKEQ